MHFMFWWEGGEEGRAGECVANHIPFAREVTYLEVVSAEALAYLLHTYVADLPEIAPENALEWAVVSHYYSSMRVSA